MAHDAAHDAAHDTAHDAPGGRRACRNWRVIWWSCASRGKTGNPQSRKDNCAVLLRVEGLGV